MVVGKVYCYFKMYPGLVLISMVRHIDKKMTDMKEEVYTQKSLKTGGTACHTGPNRKEPWSVRKAEGARRKCGQQPLLTVSVRKARQGEHV